MSKAIVVMKREFLEFVRTRTFIIATLLGPAIMVGFFALEFFILTRAGGGEYSLVVVDQSAQGVGQVFVQQLPELSRNASLGRPPVFQTSLIEQPADVQALIDSLEQRVQADSLHGYLVIPAGIMTGESARYYGSNATSQTVTAGLRSALENVVHSMRLEMQGIDPTRAREALQPVRLVAEKTGSKGIRGSAEGGQMIAFFMSFAMYMAVLLYGAAIMNGVLEEKRDKIVEVIVSSLRARDLLLGKVVGIAAAGLLQMFVWVLTVGLVLAYAGAIATLFKLGPDKAQAAAAVTGMLPKVPASIGLIFLLFFAGGFFIYSTLYATVGSIVTTNQEAQQLVFPIIMPFIIGLFIAMLASQNPDSGMAVAGSFIPLTSPLVMPVRAVAGAAGLLQITLSLVLLLITALLIVYVAGKIYRIGIFATGKRPTMAELARWIRVS